jgi:hypothetical protein
MVDNWEYNVNKINGINKSGINGRWSEYEVKNMTL